MTRDEVILDLAWRSIRHGLDHGRPLEPDSADLPPNLSAPGAAFITLIHCGELRGCIGSAIAYRPLSEDIAENAYAAAFRDPRFPPLSPAEWNGLRVSVSLLTPPEQLDFANEAELLAQLRPGVDGLIIEDRDARALFLPSVWEHLPVKRDFLAHLKRKAGLRDAHWSHTFTAQRFQAQKVGRDF